MIGSIAIHVVWLAKLLIKVHAIQTVQLLEQQLHQLYSSITPNASQVVQVLED